MGADPYCYYIDYEEDKNSALQKLRQREFDAGRYFPIMDKWDIPYALDNLSLPVAPAPGKRHEFINEVFEDEDTLEEGTYSILDLIEISYELKRGAAYVLMKEELIEYLGTDKPTREIIEDKIEDYYDYLVEVFTIRGVGVCITVYKDDVPTGLYFGGHTYD